jgi:hypothetical protein
LRSLSGAPLIVVSIGPSPAYGRAPFVARNPVSVGAVASSVKPALASTRLPTTSWSS